MEYLINDRREARRKENLANRKLCEFFINEINNNRDVATHLSELYDCCERATQTEKPYDREYWLKVSKYAKAKAVEFLKNTNDAVFGNIYEVFLLYEARHMVLDSYMLYLEKNRLPKDKFYLPRRKCFQKIGLIQALQDMLDDKLDILSISMPPGVGKLIADDTPILTSKGWKTHGDLKVGDKVFGMDGRYKKVLAVSEPGIANCQIEFSNGEIIQCHENHEWLIYDKTNCEYVQKIVETKEFLHQKPTFVGPLNKTYYKWELPIRLYLEHTKWNQYPNLIGVAIVNCKKIKPRPGKCIQVEGGVYCVGKTCIPTHNSTLEKFFHSGVCGWFPNDYNLFWSHSADITRMYYDGMVDILTNDLEYTWHEIFPSHIVLNQNAKLEQINIDKYKPFPNVQTTSNGAKNAGKVRASKFLLCDDFIGSMEEALNKNYLDKLWNIYSVDSKQRKVPGCKEIHIATRWSVNDIIGRISRVYADDDRCRFIAVPDIDAQTGESNFEFDVNPFTVAFFNDQQKVMDEVSYRCLYKNDPIEREGLLYSEDNIRRFYTLPEGQPDEILAQVDCKGKGTDYMVMPVLVRYGEDYYCVDCVCSNNADYEVQYESLANKIVYNKVNNCEFESNAGGDRVAIEVTKRVEEMGWICNITDKPTETNKEARIFQCSNWIKQHILFKAKENYDAKSDYGTLMSELLSYSITGKNPHDDVPDCFANFSLRMKRRESVNKIEVFDRRSLGF